jgi:hypothetical protein
MMNRAPDPALHNGLQQRRRGAHPRAGDAAIRGADHIDALGSCRASHLNNLQRKSSVQNRFGTWRWRSRQPRHALGALALD